MSGEINVFARSQKIYVDPVSSSVSVVNAGPPGGPQGIQGVPGEVTTVAMNAAIAAALASSAPQTFLTNLKAAKVATSQTTTSMTYVDLATVGPSVSCVTGTSALLLVSSNVLYSGGGNTYQSWISIAVSGATTVAAADANSIMLHNPYATYLATAMGLILMTGLTAGTNVFTAKYRAHTTATATFSERILAVIPIL